MYKVKPDKIIQFPYGSVIGLVIDNPLSIIKETEDTLLGQIRNQYGDLLTELYPRVTVTSPYGPPYIYDFNPRKNNRGAESIIQAISEASEYIIELISEDLIPIGLHFMDIAVGNDTGILKYSETFNIEIVASVTQPWWIDRAGMDKRYPNVRKNT